MLSLVILTSCFSDSGGESSSGKLFTGHKPANNAFHLNPNYAGVFVQGDRISFSLQHPFIISVTGVPRLEIDLDSSTVFANYVSGSGSNTLNFEYIIQAGDNDLDGIVLNPMIDLNGGSLKYTANSFTEDANLAFEVSDQVISIVDTTAPLITTLTPPAADLYLKDKKMHFTISFDEDVVVTGVPKLEIDLGGTSVNATYISGSGSKKLIFRYVVQELDQDLSGVLPLSPLNLEGATIKDLNGNNAVITFTTGQLSNVLVDGKRPYITNILTPENKTYYLSDVIQLSFTFNNPVTVTGLPLVQFTNGSSHSYLSYFSGSGSNTLIFTYSVLTGDLDLDGVSLSDTIDLNGGTIVDAEVNSAHLGFTAPLTPGVLINAAKAEVISITPPTDNSYVDLQELFFTLSFDQAITVNGSPRLPVHLTSGLVYATYDSGSGTNHLAFKYIVQNGDVDADGVSIQSSLELNSGTLTGENAVKAKLDISTSIAALNTSGILINPATLFIDSVNAPANQTYAESDNIDFIINTSEVAIVSGTPRLTLDIGGTQKFANYLSGSGTNALTFRYTVQASDPSDLDGIELFSPLDFNGGTIENGVTTALNPVFTSPDLSLVVVDPSLPMVSITNPTEASYINSSSNSATFPISGTCSENGQTVSIEINSVPASSPVGFICDGINFSGTIDTTGLSEAAHVIQANISNVAANEGSSPLINVVKDSVVPSITAITPPSNKTWVGSEVLSFTLTYGEIVNVTGTPHLQVTIGSTNYNFSYVGGDGTTELTFNYTLTNSEEDSDGISFNSSLINLNSGSITDAASNPSNLNLDANLTLPNLTSVLVDAIIPEISITSSANITSANQNNYVISGICSENGIPVMVNIGGISLSPTCSANAWSTTATDVSALADHPAIFITADQSDAAGNNANQASTSVEKNIATPVVEITNAISITQSNHTAYAISGTCSENGRIVSAVLGSISVSSNCSGGFWSTSVIDVSGESDSTSFPITADHENTSGVAAIQASLTVVKDTMAPTVIISSAPSITVENQTSYMISGTCSENGRTVAVYIDSLNFNPSCTSGAWTTGFVDVSSLSDGSAIPVTADHDNASSTSALQATAIIVKSTLTPTVSNLSVASSLTSSVDLTWTISDPGGYTLSDHIINYRIKGNPTWITFDDGTSVTNSTTVTGLNPSTTYEFRVALTYDTTETSAFTNISEGMTQPDDPLFNGPNKAMNVGGSTDTNVVAYYNNTRVYLNGVEIAASPLSQGQVVNLTTARYDVIDADGPIYTAGELGTGTGSSGANVVWNPTSWAGRTFNFNATRSNPQTVWVYAIENSSIEVKSGTTVLDTLTLAAGSGGTLSWSVFGSFQIASTGTILAYHMSGTGTGTGLADPKPLLPAAYKIIGFPSRNMTLTTDSESTNYSLIHGNSATDSGVLNRSSAINIGPQGSNNLYAGTSLVITADKKLAGYSYADGDGYCAAPFLPTNLMKKRYIINSNADYVAFASLESGTIDVYSPAQTIGVSTPVQTLTLTRSGANPNAPYNARLGTTTEGYRFVSSVPIAAWYQPNNSIGSGAKDETVLHGTDL